MKIAFDLRYVLLLLLFVTVLASCGGLGASGKQELGIASAVEAVDSQVDITTETTQEQDVSSGAKVRADTVESVTTENYAGVPVAWFIAGALIFGLIMPQPRFIRWIF